MKQKKNGRVMYTCQGYADAPEVTFVEKPEPSGDWFAKCDAYHIFTPAELSELQEELAYAAWCAARETEDRDHYTYSFGTWWAKRKKQKFLNSK